MIANDGNRDVGWMLYYIDDGKIECQQSLFLNESAIVKTISYFSKNFSGFLYCDDKFEVENANVIEYAMVKALNGIKVNFENEKIMILEQY